MVRALTYPLAFLSGWLFNFLVDIKFLTGFLSGWMAHGLFTGERPDDCPREPAPGRRGRRETVTPAGPECGRRTGRFFRQPHRLRPPYE